MENLAYTESGNGTQYDPHSTTYLDADSTDVPQISSFSPQRGPGSTTRFLVNFSTLYDIHTRAEQSCVLMFGARKCGVAMSKLDPQNGVYQYAVATDVPSFSSTGWAEASVPVILILESGADASTLHKVDVGVFRYTDVPQSSISNSTTRDASVVMVDENSQVLESTTKSESDSSRARNEYDSFSYPTQDAAYYVGVSQSSNYAMMPQYSRENSGYSTQSQQRAVYSYPQSVPPSPPSQRLNSPSPWYGSIQLSRQSPPSIGSFPASRATLSSIPSPNFPNPQLQRTTTIHPTPGSIDYGSGNTIFTNSNYHKAQLNIQGNLDSMAILDHWSPEELATKRRIVHFRISQSGIKLTVSFKPISQEFASRPPQKACVSCIWWEEKGEKGACYVTSVEIINLLEQIVSVKFATDEKNRIRRNIEGFVPQTIKKTGADTKNFFKTIMDFPNPKPRHIEKDVKVFQWNVLSSVLNKIIGKYVSVTSIFLRGILNKMQSATPDTMMPTLLTPMSTMGYTPESSGASYTQPTQLHRYPMELQQSLSSPRCSSQPMTGSYTNQPNPPLSPPFSRSSSIYDPLRIGVSGIPQAQYYPDPIPHRPHVTGYTSQTHGSTVYSTPQSARPSWDLAMTPSVLSNDVLPTTTSGDISGYLETTTGNVNAGSANNNGLPAHFNMHDDTPVGISIPKLLDAANISNSHHLSTA